MDSFKTFRDQFIKKFKVYFFFSFCDRSHRTKYYLKNNQESHFNL